VLDVFANDSVSFVEYATREISRRSTGLALMINTVAFKLLQKYSQPFHPSPKCIQDSYEVQLVAIGFAPAMMEFSSRVMVKSGLDSE